MCPGISLRGSMKSSGGEQCDQVVGMLPWAHPKHSLFHTVEMGSSSRCAPCPHSDSEEPFQCMFPIVPVQRLAVMYGRQCVRPSRPSSWASMHVPHTLTHLGTWEGTHSGLDSTASPSGETPSQEARGAMKWPSVHAWAPLSSHTPPFCSFVAACLQFYLCSNSVLPRVINSRAHH